LLQFPACSRVSNVVVRSLESVWTINTNNTIRRRFYFVSNADISFKAFAVYNFYYLQLFCIILNAVTSILNIFVLNIINFNYFKKSFVFLWLYLMYYIIILSAFISFYKLLINFFIILHIIKYDYLFKLKLRKFKQFHMIFYVLL